MTLLHPTILIGYGAYGLTVLRRFLTGASERGVLVWEDPPGAGGPGARRLRDLALIWIPDHTGAEGHAAGGDLAKDLYRQIRTVRQVSRSGGEVSAHVTEKQLLADVLMTEKKRLLDVGGPMAGRTRLRNGLDVFVLAQPVGEETLGALESLLPPSMEAIANDPGLRTLAAGAELLNFVQFFDFENFWDRGPHGRKLRRATREFVQRWQERVRSGRPGFGRIYITQASAGQGIRDENLRVEETRLFLEFLLFEGLRDDERIRRLFQRDLDERTSLGTFAVRVIERSRGLLSRLVAARFAFGWLDYMAGSKAARPVEAREVLRERLRRFQPATLDLSPQRADLDRLVEQNIRWMEAELRALPVDDPGWPKRFRTEVQRMSLRVKDDLASWAGAQTQQIADRYLADLRASIERAITESLHHAGTPTTLGLTIEELQKLQEELRQFDPLPERPDSREDSLAAIDEIHRTYQYFKWSQVNPSKMAEWWAVLALVLGVAWTPVVLEAVESLSTPGADATLWRAGYDALIWLAKPGIIGLLTTAVAWASGWWLLHSAVRKRVERGLRTYTHPDTGIIAGAIRKALCTGLLRDSIEAHADLVFRNMNLGLRSEVLREAGHALERLTTRQREMQWLRARLRDYMQSHGVDENQPLLRFTEIRHATFCHSVQKDEDLQRLLARNPLSTDRFESTQTARRPFSDWAQRYCDTFLYPVSFLEDLSREYEDHEEAGQTDSAYRVGARAADLCEFLERFQGFSPGMTWSAEQGGAAPVTESFCLIPQTWYNLTGVANGLRDHQFSDHRILWSEDPERAYLVRVQLAIPAERLLDAEDE